MAIVKMKHLRLVAMRENRDTLLRLLQRMGCVEIDEPSVDESDPAWAGLTRPGAGDLSDARERHGAVERALAVLKRCAPAKDPLLKPQPALTERELFDERATQAALEEAKEINEADRRLNTIHAEETKLLAQKSALAPWLSLDLPLDTQSTGQVVIQLGTLPSGVPFAQAEGAVLAAGDLSQLTLVSADREQQYLLSDIDSRNFSDRLMNTLLELRLNGTEREELYFFCRTILRGAATQKGIDLIDHKA